MSKVDDPSGWVYVAEHPAWRCIGMCKIGMTRRDPVKRMRELTSASGLIARGRIAYSARVADRRAAERHVHALLAQHRVRRGRELFRVDLETAGMVVGQVAAQFHRRPRRSLVGWLRGLFVVVLVCAPCAARAQIPVTDVANLGQQFLHYAQMLKDYAQQAASYARQGEQLTQEAQTVLTLEQQLQAFVQNPNLGSAMGLMNMAGLENPLPGVNPYAIQGLLNGQGGISGALGNLSSLANGSLGSNTYYKSNDGSWLDTESQNRANGTAGAQSVGMSILQQLANHVPVMQALRTQLLAANTPKQVQDAQAALATEQLWAENATGQLQAVSLMYSAQRDANEERQNQRLDESIDKAIAAAKAHGDWQ